MINCIGSIFGFLGGKVQECLYRRYAPTVGVEARLFAPMVAGVLFAVGCYITGATAQSHIPWIGSAIGQVVMIGKLLRYSARAIDTDADNTAAIMSIYVTAFS
jgi:hypothetical protein